LDTSIRSKPHEFSDADIAELSTLWDNNISSPPPNTGQFVRWLQSFGKVILKNAINTCIRKYAYMFRTGTPMTYDHAVRYTSSVARNAQIAAETFHAPAEWTD
jgi:hypothetical protein